MKCYQIPEFKKDLDDLKKQYPSIERDIAYIIKLFEENYLFAERAIPSSRVGVRDAFKIRVASSNLPFGKSKGLRLIYKKDKESNKVIFLLLYSHSQYKKDIYALNKVKDRASSLEYASEI